MRLICSIFFLLTFINTALAVKAPPYPVRVKQPDGSIISLYIKGDEFFRYAVTADGKRMVRGRDGFFRSAAAISPAEAAMIRTHNLNRAYAAGSPGVTGARTGISPSGEVRVLVIPVEFADLSFTVSSPRDHFDRMLNSPGYSDNGGTGSAKDYFEANIPGTSFRFDVTEPVRLSRSYAYYGENDDTTPSVITYDVRLPELVREACTLADTSADFSDYDLNGDGQVDFVFFYLAGYNEAESGDDYAIWPQSYNIIQEGIRADGVRVGLFGCASELSGGDLGMNGIPSGIGTFCHEFGHFLGLVDLYDTDYGSNGLSNCLWGRLSLMDTGNYNNYGRTPPYFCAIDRELAGSATYTGIAAGTTVSLSPIQDKGEIIRIPTSNNGEYFLIENRSNSGWDAHIEGSGMVVYHIDRSANIVNGITAAVRWTTNLINACADHECADLLEAFPYAEHISQVFFPGQAGITELHAAGTPAFIAWDGTPVGLRLSSIMKNGQNITFDVEEDEAEILLTPRHCGITAYQNKAVLEWESGRPGAYRWIITWGEGDGTDTFRDTTTLNRYVFNALHPRTEYSCSLYHAGTHSNGDTVSLRFSTSALTSPYPYIMLRRHYFKGDTLEMVLNNIPEDYLSVRWYINGGELTGNDRYIFRNTGEYEIRAVLQYGSDGSLETVIRKITVTEPQNRKDDEYL